MTETPPRDELLPQERGYPGGAEPWLSQPWFDHHRAMNWGCKRTRLTRSELLPQERAVVDGLTFVGYTDLDRPAAPPEGRLNAWERC
jgi:hypothetical protein